MAALAFYKGRGDWLDRVIRAVTRSRYSHVELIANFNERDLDNGHNCYSSSSRDGGVRAKVIKMNNGRWDVVPVDWATGNSTNIFIQHSGAKYDYFGIVFSQFFNWRWHSKKRWFCSEIIATALGLPNPQSWSPGSLKNIAEKLNHVHGQGLREGERHV